MSNAQDGEGAHVKLLGEHVMNSGKSNNTHSGEAFLV